MEMPKLTTQEEEIYQKILKDGTMEDMFQVAYAIGRERNAKEQLDMITNFFNKQKITL